MTRRIYVAVCGPGVATTEETDKAAECGRLLGDAGAVVVTGGLGGVMAAASRGAKERGGIVLGLLPSDLHEQANPDCDLTVPTGLGEGRNVLVARTADALLAVGGEYGTLSEIALALKLGKAVVGLDTWTLGRSTGAPDDIVRARTPQEAVQIALRHAEVAAGRR